VIYTLVITDNSLFTSILCPKDPVLCCALACYESPGSVPSHDVFSLNLSPSFHFWIWKHSNHSSPNSALLNHEENIHPIILMKSDAVVKGNFKTEPCLCSMII